MSSAGDFVEPPWTSNPDGEPRRVGVEMEMTGLKPGAMADAVSAVVGGRAETESAFVTHVVDTEFGDFRIELDADVLTSRSYQRYLTELGIDIGKGDQREQFESLISRIAGLVVPLELVGPPVAWQELPAIDRIRHELHRAGARGTQSSALYAFGLQLNIEAARLDADHLLAMLRAFLLEYDWLKERARVDLSRRISPYVHPYPEDYVVHVLQADYAPGLDELIDDFLTFTPTRNRPLDMLPLFAHLDRERVMAAPVERDLIKSRPAFHYRLPNCLIDDPHWNLADAWNDWVEVERVAADPERLEKLRARRLISSSGLRRWFSGLLRRFRS